MDYESLGKDELISEIKKLKKIIEDRYFEIVNKTDVWLKDVLSSISDLFFIFDKDERFIFFNAPKNEKLYLPPEEFIGKKHEDVMPIEITKEFKKGIEYNKNRKHYEWDYSLDIEGEKCFFHSILSPIFVNDIYEGSVAVIRDITDYIKIKNNLQEERNKLMATLQSIGDAVIVADVEGKITMMNPVAENLTEWSFNEAKGKYLNEIFFIINQFTRKVCENPFEHVIKNKECCNLANNTLLITKTGKEVNIEDSGTPIIDTNGEIIGVILVFRDVTQKIKLREEIIKRQKENIISLMAGGLAHDFNNILTAILGNVSILSNEIKDNNYYKCLIDNTIIAIDKAKNLTQQLLTLSKGGLPVKKIVSLNKLIKECVDITLSGSNILVDYRLENNLWNCYADIGQIYQAVQNIVINAKDAMPKGGKLEIETENLELKEKLNDTITPGKYISITFRDHGFGISKENLSKIFDPFYTTKSKGTGLGLYVVESVIEKHNGHIKVNSEMGNGTEFKIFIPAIEEGEEIIYKTDDQIIKGKGRILLLEDEEQVAKVLIEMLKIIGYEVDWVSDGEKAIETFMKSKNQEINYSLLILDLTIPGGMGGIETFEKIHKIDSNVKAIISSGYSEDYVINNYSKYGFSGFIKKPYTIQALSKIINETLIK